MPPRDDNPYIKLDGPTCTLFGDSELEPLASMLRHCLANEVVNGYINEALTALPDHWIRKAGVYLPELGVPASVPGRWADGRVHYHADQRLLDAWAARARAWRSGSRPAAAEHDTSLTRIRLEFPSFPPAASALPPQ